MEALPGHRSDRSVASRFVQGFCLIAILAGLATGCSHPKLQVENRSAECVLFTGLHESMVMAPDSVFWFTKIDDARTVQLNGQDGRVLWAGVIAEDTALLAIDGEGRVNASTTLASDARPSLDPWSSDGCSR